MVLPPGDDVPEPGFDELPKSRSRTSSYLRCFSSRSFSVFACRSSAVICGGLLSSSSESDNSAPSALLRPNRDMPAAADSIPPASDRPGRPPADREAICGLRLSTVTAGLKSCFKGTADLDSRKWNVWGVSLGTRRCQIAFPSRKFLAIRKRKHTLLPIVAC